MGGLGFAMALQFKPDGSGGWLYRKDQYGAGIPVSADERDAYVRWFGWMVVLGLLLFIAAMIVMAIIADAVFGEASQALGAIVVIGMATVDFGGLYLLLRFWNHAPARAFADRLAVTPALSRRDAFAEPLAKLSYRRILFRSVMLMAIMLVAALRTPGMLWLAIALPVAIGGGIALWKWRLENGS